MKRTTTKKSEKVTEGRIALIKAAESVHKYYKGLLNKFSNKRLLGMCNPLDREYLQRNL